MSTSLDEQRAVLAQARATKRPVRIIGTGSRSFYGKSGAGAPSALPLVTAAHSGVVSYEPSELVITARAGTSLQEIEALLAQNGQMLAFEPPRFGGQAGTLGGCVAVGLAGPRRMAAGPLADFVLGVRVLDWRGDELRFGGEVMKNVAGYDISRLMAGSLGQLGVITEVSLKVLPLPRCERTLVLELAQAQSLRLALSWRAQPLPVSATAWLEQGGAGRHYVRLSGNDAAVRQAQEIIGGELMPTELAADFWQALRDHSLEFFSAPELWRLALPPQAPALEFAGAQILEWGGSQRWLAQSCEPNELRAQVAALGGHAICYRAPCEKAVDFFSPLAPAVANLQRRVKNELDPQGVFG